MNKEELKELRELRKATTQGVWDNDQGGLTVPECEYYIAEYTDNFEIDGDINAEFTVKAHNQMPKLLEYIDRLEDTLKSQYRAHESSKGYIEHLESKIKDNKMLLNMDLINAKSEIKRLKDTLTKIGDE